ncbi:MAG TPA: oligosaccharide flippase family protein [Gemmatimonadales bacterium]
MNLVVTWMVQLVMVPLLLHHLGTPSYGLFATLTSIAGYFGLLTFGSTLTVPRYVAEHAARGDREALGEFVSTYMAAHWVVAVLGLAAAFGLAPLLAHLLDLPPAMRPLIAPAFRLVAAGWALGLAGGLLQSLLTGLGQVGLANLASSARTLLNLVAVAIAIAMDGDLLTVLVALMSASVAGSVMLAILVKRRHPDIPLGPSRARLRALRSTGVSAGYYFLMQVAALVVMGTDNIVIGIFAGVALVAAYAVVAQLWATLIAMLWSGVDALMPFFTRWQVQGDRAKLHASYLGASKMAFAGSAIAAVIMVVWGTTLIGWWVGPSLEVDRRVVWTFAAMLLTASPIHTAALLLSALGKHRAPALGGAAEAALNLTLSLILIHPLGVWGVALGTLISGLMTNAWIAPRAACRELGMSVGSWAKAALLPALIPAGAAAALALVLRSTLPANVPMTLIALAAVGIVFAVLFWSLGLTDTERWSLRTLAGAKIVSPTAPPQPPRGGMQ